MQARSTSVDRVEPVPSTGAGTSPPSGEADVLVVEDRDSLRTMLRLALESAGYRVREASDQPSAEAVLARELPAVVITDLRLPAGDGLGVLRAVKQSDPTVPVVVMTAYGGIQDAVAAMKDGALDFLAKPVDPDHLRLVVGRAVAQQALVREHERLKQEAAERRGAPLIIGNAAALIHAVRAMQRAAGTEITVLVEGESGTGKELFARALHAWSRRAEGPFIAINCAAIPETLLESELFGYEKGAFTGAGQRKLGRIELAHRGTLFLDEIGELAPALQAKILRVLETREFERVGGVATIKADLRLVAATNRDLRVEVAERRFREDLYFRLSAMPITVPPLRVRGDDVLLLAHHILERHAQAAGRRTPRLDDSAQAELIAYAWPGNVRELQNCLERAAILADGALIRAEHLRLLEPTPAATPLPPDSSLVGTLAEVVARAQHDVERRKIELALVEAENDTGRAAEALGLTFRDLLAKLRHHQLGAH